MSYTIKSLVDEAEKQLLHQKATRDEPYDFVSPGGGGDAYDVHTTGTIRNIKGRGFEMKLRDIHFNGSSGTYNLNWREVDERKLEISVSGHVVVEASKCLGGRKGSSRIFGSSQEPVSPTDWDVRRLKRTSLEKVAKYLASHG